MLGILVSSGYMCGGYHQARHQSQGWPWQARVHLRKESLKKPFLWIPNLIKNLSGVVTGWVVVVVSRHLLIMSLHSDTQ